MDEPHSPCEQSEAQALIAQLAERLTRRGLAAPAIMALEVFQPWAFVGSQFLLAVEPLLGRWGRAGRRYASLLEERRHVQALIAALERYREAPRQAGEEGCQAGSSQRA